MRNGLKQDGRASAGNPARYGERLLQALPDTLQEDATAQALQTIDDLDLDELLAIDPPRGYGRD
jgi:hypothetical protein